MPRSSATESVLADLTERIESGELPLGTRLPGEEVLATRYGVTRGAVRRALRRLGAAGLTETQPGRGTFVVSAEYAVDPVLGRYSVTDLAEARPNIEVPAAGLAALRRTTEQINELERLVEEMDRESDTDKWIQLDAAFHTAIAEASGNGVYVAIMLEIRDATTRQSALLHTLAQQPRTLNAEHRAILEAITRVPIVRRRMRWRHTCVRSAARCRRCSPGTRSDRRHRMLTHDGPVSVRTLADIDDEITRCRACPRLVDWREHVAREKRAAFRDETYWGRPVPGFGPADPQLVIVGLAPAAHGANRTGRMFTGDRSGDVLYAALYAVGLASQPTATHVGDGLALFGTRTTAPVHCAPPENKPTVQERDRCREWLDAELRLLAPTVRAIVVLGGFGWQTLLPSLTAAGWSVPRPRPKFAHGAHVELAGPAASLHLFGCYHVSQQNTFTGRLTPAMLERVLAKAGRAAGLHIRDST